MLNAGQLLRPGQQSGGGAHQVEKCSHVELARVGEVCKPDSAITTANLSGYFMHVHSLGRRHHCRVAAQACMHAPRCTPQQRQQRDDSPSHKCADLAGGSRYAVARGTDVGGEHLTRQQPCGGVGPKLACKS